ncbi:hypothetical protein RI065_02915 [Mycoplasmatota bacterium zrk1]
MKKIYVLLSIMVLSLMTAGFSYAYWTDTLTLTGTATTGDFGVEFAPPGYVEVDSPYNTYQINEQNDLIELDLDNLYPGAHFWYDGMIVNTGTIPAVSGQISETIDYSFAPNLQSYIYIDVQPLPHYLDVGEMIPFMIHIWVDEAADNLTQNESVSATFVLDYDQFNE